MELGKKQELEIVKIVDFGAYLGENSTSEDRVLLPKKEVAPGTKPGDRLEVFLYKDSMDRLIATTREPKLEIGGLAVLKVKEVGSIGAFLDWGLEKDLLLPFKEQTKRVRQDEEWLVTLYVDKSSRLCATMNVYPVLRTDSPYQKEDRVKGVIYETSEEFGLFVAVDDCYSALIPRKEASGNYEIGDRMEARVTAVRPDGKLDLSPREKAYMQMDKDAEHILEVMKEFDGVLPFHDKASPEVIKRELGLSKNAFKRGVGRLLKEEKIEITEKSIRLKKTEEE